MMDAPTPPPWLVSLLAERMAPISMDAELVRQRDAVLGLARDLRESSPADRGAPQNQRPRKILIRTSETPPLWIDAVDASPGRGLIGITFASERGPSCRKPTDF